MAVLFLELESQSLQARSVQKLCAYLLVPHLKPNPKMNFKQIEKNVFLQKCITII